MEMPHTVVKCVNLDSTETNATAKPLCYLVEALESLIINQSV